MILAQISQSDDLIFRAVLIPGGLLLAFLGLRAVRRRTFHLPRGAGSIRGRPAVWLGIVIALLGICGSVAALASFFRHTPQPATSTPDQ